MENIDKQMEVFRQALDLSETMEEGLGFLKLKTEELAPEKALEVLLDTSQALTAVETALEPVMPALPENSLEAKGKQLRRAMDAILKDLKHTRGQRTLEIFRQQLEPAFLGWREELKRVLEPYTLQ